MLTFSLSPFPFSRSFPRLLNRSKRFKFHRSHQRPWMERVRVPLHYNRFLDHNRNYNRILIPLFFFFSKCRSQRYQPIVVDPAIYLARRSQIFHATEKRKTPEAFKVFTGKVSVINIILLSPLASLRETNRIEAKLKLMD